MILAANEITVGEVTAFIGPLIAAIGLVGAFIAWVMTRTSRFVQQQITSTQAVTNERIARLTEQLVNQGKALETLSNQSRDTAITVARIEGKLNGGGSSTSATHD